MQRTGPLACHVPSNTPGLSAWRPRSFSQEYFGSLISRSDDELAMALASSSFSLKTLQLLLTRGRTGRNLADSIALLLLNEHVTKSSTESFRGSLRLVAVGVTVTKEWAGLQFVSLIYGIDPYIMEVGCKCTD